jgi:hypothetical protein
VVVLYFWAWLMIHVDNVYVITEGIIYEGSTCKALGCTEEMGSGEEEIRVLGRAVYLTATISPQLSISTLDCNSGESFYKRFSVRCNVASNYSGELAEYVGEGGSEVGRRLAWMHMRPSLSTRMLWL